MRGGIGELRAGDPTTGEVLPPARTGDALLLLPGIYETLVGVVCFGETRPTVGTGDALLGDARPVGTGDAFVGGSRSGIGDARRADSLRGEASMDDSRCPSGAGGGPFLGEFARCSMRLAVR